MEIYIIVPVKWFISRFTRLVILERFESLTDCLSISYYYICYIEGKDGSCVFMYTLYTFDFPIYYNHCVGNRYQYNIF